MAKRVVGFIGLGLMGQGMATNILRKGNDLLVMAHRNRAPIEALVAEGAREVKTPKEMAAAADTIVLCVTGSPEVEGVVHGEDGILAGARPGLLVIDTSTADPVSTTALAAEMKAAGVTLVDAPLSRTPKDAAAGTLDVMVGADDEAFARAKPVIDCFAGRVVHVGPVGAGHTMKLLNNFVSISYAAIYSEALALGKRVGIAPKAFNAVIGGGRMSCGMFETFMKYVIERDRDAHKFTISNAHKDMRYLMNLVNASGSANVVAPVVKGYLASAEAMGKGGDYLTMLSDHVAALNGVDLSKG
jgi:3-hydroxyisobutyrate dehydrogenase-like beta-hydroxyacid dehydrogenase